jgi:nitroreductase
MADNNNGDSSPPHNDSETSSPYMTRLDQHRRQFSYATPMLQSDTDARHHHHPRTRTVFTDISEIDSGGTLPLEESSSSVSATATALQSLLRTRRTTSHYRYPSHHSMEFYRAAIDRAVAAGRSAPNHKRTEAVSFRRIASDTTISRLADIASKVSQNPSKGEKWKRTPSFLVTLVHQDTMQEEEDVSTTTTPEDFLYKPMTYIPPTSTMELEDYAAACAATQNVLLSLHSEGLATKWATGPIIQTPAFRSLIDAGKTDRVVALIFIGEAAASQKTLQRTYRRTFHGDFLRDV